MNIYINSLLLFIYIFITFVIGILTLENNYIIKDKFIIFICVFIFQLLINSINKLNTTKQNINIKSIIKYSIFIAVLSVIGFSLYFDFLNIECTIPYLKYFSHNLYYKSFFISTIITSFVFFCLVIELLLLGKNCESKPISNNL